MSFAFCNSRWRWTAYFTLSVSKSNAILLRKISFWKLIVDLWPFFNLLYQNPVYRASIFRYVSESDTVRLRVHGTQLSALGIRWSKIILVHLLDGRRLFKTLLYHLNSSLCFVGLFDHINLYIQDHSFSHLYQPLFDLAAARTVVFGGTALYGRHCSL